MAIDPRARYFFQVYTSFDISVPGTDHTKTQIFCESGDVNCFEVME